MYASLIPSKPNQTQPYLSRSGDSCTSPITSPSPKLPPHPWPKVSSRTASCYSRPPRGHDPAVVRVTAVGRGAPLHARHDGRWPRQATRGATTAVTRELAKADGMWSGVRRQFRLANGDRRLGAGTLGARGGWVKTQLAVSGSTRSGAAGCRPSHAGGIRSRAGDHARHVIDVQ